MRPVFRSNGRKYCAEILKDTIYAEGALVSDSWIHNAARND